MKHWYIKQHSRLFGNNGRKQLPISSRRMGAPWQSQRGANSQEDKDDLKTPLLIESMDIENPELHGNDVNAKPRRSSSDETSSSKHISTAVDRAKHIDEGSESHSAEAIDAQIFDIALPTLATLAADPLASLISTAWVGRIGAVELAGVGVALSVYGAFTKLLNMPVLAVVTGTTATALGASGGCTRSEGVARAVTSSLILALCVGLLQCVLVLGLGIKGLAIWGAGADTIMYDPAKSYLLVRALGLPAGVLMLSLQGAFRGLGDARTPLLITIVCNVVNVVLEPTLIFGLNLGVAGAALAVVSAQAVSVGLLVYLLSKKIDFKRHVGAAHASLTDTVKFVKPTALLAARTASITAVYAIATGLVARTDANHAAAHQVAFQLWLASSLLADSLAVAAQALLARWLADDDAHVGASAGRGKLIVERVNQLALWLGIALALGLTVGTEVLHLPKLFSKDAEVLSVLGVLMPIVIATQPINALAFTLDGVAYGVGAFSYAAKAMIVAAIPAVGIMYAGFKLAAGSVDYQIFAVWAGLAAVMVGRVLTFAVPLFKFKHPFEMLKTS